MYFTVYSAHLCFWPKHSGKNSFILIFKFNYLFICLFALLFIYILFLYYKRILACIFEHTIQKIYITNNYKTQEQIQGTRNFKKN